MAIKKVQCVNLEVYGPRAVMPPPPPQRRRLPDAYQAVDRRWVADTVSGRDIDPGQTFFGGSVKKLAAFFKYKRLPGIGRQERQVMGNDHYPHTAARRQAREQLEDLYFIIYIQM